MIHWTIYRADHERRSIDCTSIYRGAPEALEAPTSAVLRVRPASGGTTIEVPCTCTGGGSFAPLRVDIELAPNTLPFGELQAWLVLTWADGPVTWPDPARDPCIAITVLDRG